MNELQLTGRLVKICPKESGTSKSSGKEWSNLTFVIETEDTQYHKLIAMVLFGDKITYLDKFNIGDELTVKFSVESKEHNGRYFTSANAYSIQGTAKTGTNQTTGSLNNYSSVVKDAGLPPTEYATQEPIQDEDSDLPF